MVIKGLQKTTLLDYPGKVAATVFLGGCNMRCPFCHNMDIVKPDIEDEGDYSVSEILDFLKSRKGILDGVCITGGEPTINPDLPDFIARVKELGYSVKLDTNGTNPDMVKSLVQNGLIDYVAMDIKSSPAMYEAASGTDGIKLVNIKETVDYLIGVKSGDFDYEFRTTVVDAFHNREVMEDIGKLIKGAGKYYLQGFVDSEYVPDHSLKEVSKEELSEFVKIMSAYVKKAEIRGVE